MRGRKILLLCAVCMALSGCQGAQKEEEKTSIRMSGKMASR